MKEKKNKIKKLTKLKKQITKTNTQITKTLPQIKKLNTQIKTLNTKLNKIMTKHMEISKKFQANITKLLKIIDYYNNQPKSLTFNMKNNNKLSIKINK
jgi:predicted  nucleic acid-binding Zn-ribbon protein